MQLHQIVIRPQDNLVIVLYMDAVGQRYTKMLNATNLPGIPSVVAGCQAQLPADSQHPAKPEIQQEITELESRISTLKQAIGQPV